MATKRPLPRHTLARNLKLLMETTDLSAPEVARRAGVDRKTLNNQLNGRYDPRPEQVDAVAVVFGRSGWELLNPNFDPQKAVNGNLKHLAELYGQASEEGRNSILKVAEMAATYRVK